MPICPTCHQPIPAPPNAEMQIIEELHYFVQSLWARNRRDTVPLDALIRFLAARVPPAEIKQIIATAIRANIIALVAPGRFVPRPKHEHYITPDSN